MKQPNHKVRYTLRQSRKKRCDLSHFIVFLVVLSKLRRPFYLQYHNSDKPILSQNLLHYLKPRGSSWTESCRHYVCI